VEAIHIEHGFHLEGLIEASRYPAASTVRVDGGRVEINSYGMHGEGSSGLIGAIHSRVELSNPAIPRVLPQAI